MIDASLIKNLRDQTGAGYMDCKEALTNSSGDMEKAIELLRKKGTTNAIKKIGRKTNQGAVVSYIHPGNRIGVIVEINCETDFVAKTDQFLKFAKDIAMQVAATNPLAIDRKGLSSDVIEKEKDIYFAQAKSLNKPKPVLEKIVEGKLEKFYQETCLLEQHYIKDQQKTIQDIVTEIIAALGENIIISRFSRFEVGEQFSSNGDV